MAIQTINCDGITLSLLAPGAYELVFGRIPTCNFMCQSVLTPTVSFGRAKAAFSKHDVFLTGEKLNFGDLTASILVDSNLQQYTEMYKWMHDLSVLNNPIDAASTCTLIAGDKTFSFEGVFPVEMTGIPFTSILTDVPPITFQVTFSHIKFDLI